MIIDTRENLQRYVSLNPHFPTAFEFLMRDDLDSLAPGRHEISAAEGVFVMVTNKLGLPDEDSHIEAHRKYIDIQYILAGKHRIGWLPAGECGNVSIPYAEDRDIVFYSDAPRFWTILPRCHFAILFPEDAHAPVAVDGMIHKVVVKVPV